MEASSTTVEHDAEARRYVLRAADGAELGHSAYLPAGASVIVSHTEIEPGHEGEGLGSLLVRATLTGIRDSGKTVIPTCPFTSAYIARHPEWVEVVDPSLRGRFGA